jgi:hypothetical protein
MHFQNPCVNGIPDPGEMVTFSQAGHWPLSIFLGRLLRAAHSLHHKDEAGKHDEAGIDAGSGIKAKCPQKENDPPGNLENPTNGLFFGNFGWSGCRGRFLVEGLLALGAKRIPDIRKMSSTMGANRCHFHPSREIKANDVPTG